jgi:hypothetical protein
MFVHGHPRALGWVKGHYRPPHSPTGEQLGLDLELEVAVSDVPKVPGVPEIPRPREETSAAAEAREDQPARSRSRVSASASTQSRLTTAIRER